MRAVDFADATSPCSKCGAYVVEAYKTPAKPIVLERVVGSAGGNYGIEAGPGGVLQTVGLTVHQARMRVQSGRSVWIEHRGMCGGRR